MLHCTGTDTGDGEILMLGPVGEFHRFITVQPDGSICAGCFHDTLEAFIEAVNEKYGDSCESYNRVIQLLKERERIAEKNNTKT